MIHHLSIGAHDPAHVADVLAELMGGRSLPFPGAIGGAFIAVNGDAHGTMIEVYPKTVTLHPGTGDLPGQIEHRDGQDYGPVHFLLSVPIDRAMVEQIGQRERWRTRYLGRGAPGQPPAFHVIEFWVENQLMIEVTTPDMLPEYLQQVRFDMRQDAGRSVQRQA